MSAPLHDGKRSRRAKPPLKLRWEDEARFIRTWLESPKITGAVSPSGRFLSRTIARCVDPASTGPVIELGPGTGPVTAALIRRGISPERLILVEFDAAFCKLLARRFPACTVVQGDAYSLARTLRHLRLPPAAAVVSSLPLLNRPEHHRIDLFLDALALMRPGAPFVQFTYGLASPIPKTHLATCAPVETQASAPVWLNLPPARVWTYRLVTGAMAEVSEPDLIDRLRRGRGRLETEWREHRQRLREEFLARSAEAKAEWKARAQRVKLGIAKRSGEHELRGTRASGFGDKRSRW